MNADLTDPVLKYDIQITPDTLAFLKSVKDTCFLCKWILQDFEKNGTLTGHYSANGEFEIFPVKGMVNHISLHRYGRPYPFKVPPNAVESTITSSAPQKSGGDVAISKPK